MNKFTALASVVGLAMAFTACDNYELPKPQAPVNEQQPIFQADELTISPLEEGALVNLADYTYEESEAPVGSYVIENWPAGYDLGLTAEIASTADFASYRTLPATANDGEIYINGPELNRVAMALYGKQPIERDLYVRYIVTADRGDKQEFIIGGPDAKVGPFLLPVKVYHFEIEPAYYIVSSLNGWKPVALSHTGDNVYDDPNFSIVYEEAPAGGFNFVIVAQSQLADLNAGKPYASFGSADTNKGSLVAGTDNENAATVTTEGKILVKVNMESLTWEVLSAYENIFVPSEATGLSSPKKAQKLYTTDYVTYQGYAYLQGKYQFTLDTAKKGAWAMGDEEGTLAFRSDKYPTVETPGLYYVRMSLVSMTYSVQPVTEIGIVGDGTPFGWPDDANVTDQFLAPADASQLVWTGDVEFLATGVWKFRCNRAWDVNLGGSILDLVQGGADMPTPGAGVYTVTLNLSELPYTATVVAK